MQRFPRIDAKLALWAVAIFLVLMAVFVPSFAFRQREETALIEARERFTSAQVAERFSQLVSMRVKTLELLQYTRSAIETEDRFTVWSSRIEQKIQGFYAINWIDPRGVITSVVPVERNVKALGKNLLEREDTRPYLLLAKESRGPVMSHVIDLYQGPAGVVIYTPLFEGTEFRGWINGVFTSEELVGNLLVSGEFDSAFLSIKFHGHQDKVVTHGTLKEGRRAPTPFSFQILNQKVEIEVAPNAAAVSDATSRLWTWLIFVLVTACSAALSVFAYLLMLSRQRLEQRLEKERVHGILLNLLVHDIVNPMMIVRFGGETAQRLAPPELKAPLEKVLYGVSQINEVIGRVKDLRAVEAGRFVPKVEGVPVNDVIDEATRLFEQRLKAKELQGHFERAPADTKVLVDRVIFQNNVLSNLLSNAVKFSEKGGQVSLRYLGEDGRFVILEVRDHGMGMSEAIRSNLFLENADVLRPGTLGEKGTGIGMLQVKTYMKVFGGHVTVESKAKTTGAADHGTAFKLFVPKAT